MDSINPVTRHKNNHNIVWAGAFLVDELSNWASVEKLTPREKHVALRLHLTDKEIAEQLAISVRNTESYVKNIFAKLGVRTRTAAAIICYCHWMSNGDF